MARITDTFSVEEVSGRSRHGRQLVRLLTPLTYHVGHADSDEVITVPKGYETDFASVPRMFWGLIPPLGAYARPAIIHDYLYDAGGLRRYTRKQCDEIFKEAMDVVGVPAWKRNLMFAAVRIGGGGGFTRLD